MSTVELKTNITKMLGAVNDERFLKSVFVMVKEFSNTELGLSEKQLAELDKRVKNHKAGKTENYPWKASLKAIRKELGK
jgi:hypothetical protein